MSVLTRFLRAVTSPGWFRRAWRRMLWRLGIGHRAAFLMGFGVIYGVLGLGVILSPAPQDPLLFHTQLPYVVRFGLWSAAGLVAFLVAVSSRWQWVGFIALTPPPVERAMSYAGAVAETFPPGPPIPWPYLNGLVLYAGLLFIVGLVSTWTDPPTDPPTTERVA